MPPYSRPCRLMANQYTTKIVSCQRCQQGSLLVISLPTSHLLAKVSLSPERGGEDIKEFGFGTPRHEDSYPRVGLVLVSQNLLQIQNP